MKIATECSTERLNECSTERLLESLAEWRAVLLFQLYLVKHPQLLTCAREAPKRYADIQLFEDTQNRFVC